MAGGGRKNGDPVLAAALASGGTWKEAAEAAGVSERTVGRRLKDPAFRGTVSRLREEIFSRAAARPNSPAGLPMSLGPFA